MKRSFSIPGCYLVVSVGVYAAMAGVSFGQIFQGNQRQSQPASQPRVVGQARTQVVQPQAGQQRYQQGTIQYGQPAGQRVVQGQYEQGYNQWDGDQAYRSQSGLSNQQEIERRLASIEREIRQLRQLLQQQGSSQQSYTRSSDRDFDGGSGQYDRYDRQYDDESYQQTSGRYGTDRMQNRERYEQQSYGGRYSNDESDYRSGSSGTSSGRNESDYSGSDSRSRTADRRSSSGNDSQSNSGSSRSSRSSNDEDEDYQSSSRSGSNSQRSNSGRAGESSSSSRDSSDSSQDD